MAALLAKAPNPFLAVSLAKGEPIIACVSFLVTGFNLFWNAQSVPLAAGDRIAFLSPLGKFFQPWVVFKSFKFCILISLVRWPSGKLLYHFSAAARDALFSIPKANNALNGSVIISPASIPCLYCHIFSGIIMAGIAAVQLVKYLPGAVLIPPTACPKPSITGKPKNPDLPGLSAIQFNIPCWVSGSPVSVFTNSPVVELYSIDWSVIPVSSASTSETWSTVPETWSTVSGVSVKAQPVPAKVANPASMPTLPPFPASL